jgi:serine phosphatase RsbU (regulator of sigma subunit)
MVSGDGSPVRTLSPTGTPLGILPNPTYDQQCTTLTDPACLMIYTDGLTEALDPTGDMFGRDRLDDWLRANVRFPCAAEELCESLSAELDRFRSGTPLRDDQTYLILADKSTPAVMPPQDFRSSTESDSGKSSPASPTNTASS